MTDVWSVVLRRPSTATPSPVPPSASDYDSVVMDACMVLAETDIHFGVCGFGQSTWPVDISYDLSTFVEGLPEAIGNLVRRAPAVIDMYGQGLERALSFEPHGGDVQVHCTSRTSWRPDPPTVRMRYADVVGMLSAVAEEFAASLAVIWPTDPAAAATAAVLRDSTAPGARDQPGSW